MDILSVSGIALGLSMDAFAAAISAGTTRPGASWGDAVKTGFFFGGFQAVMPMLGWAAGKLFEHSLELVDHWIALLLLSFLGIRMLCGSLREEAPADFSIHAHGFLQPGTLLLLAVATSIDAMAAGILLPSAVGADTLPLLLCAVGVIGGITFLLSAAGVLIGRKFGGLLRGRAERFGGVTLILIGIKILVEHLRG